MAFSTQTTPVRSSDMETAGGRLRQHTMSSFPAHPRLHGPCTVPANFPPAMSLSLSPLLQDASLLPDLSLLSVPKYSSNVKLQLSFPLPPSPLPSGVFCLDAPWHFTASCLIGTFTWPKTTSVNGSNHWGLTYCIYLWLYLPHHCPPPTFQLITKPCTPCLSSPVDSLVWKRNECLSSLRHQGTGLKGISIVLGVVFPYTLVSVGLQVPQELEFVFNFKSFEQVFTICWAIGKW